MHNLTPFNFVDEQRVNDLSRLLNEQEALLKERKMDLEEQQEEFMAQKEELNAAVEELMAKNQHLTNALRELQQRNQELDHILYQASHDLKTPVSSIYGLINILQSGTLTADQAAATTHLLEQARLINLKLDGLTNLSNAFFREPQPQECSIKQLVTSAWSSTVRPADISLSLSDNDQRITVDPDLFVVAIRCLLDNAVVYRRKNGQITVSWIKKESIIEITVMDDGEGIDPKISDRIFNMFYRGSERSKGAGLGLYITKTIADKLKGNVQYIPSDGETTFRLSLPA